MRLSYLVYKAACGLVRAFFRPPEIIGAQNLPEGPCVIVGNHAHMNGPIIAELFLPGERVTWCNAQMMHLKEVPDYAYQDFWSRKPIPARWLFRVASYLIAPLSVCIFNNARCIPVYHDMRIANTFRQTLKALGEGKRVVIFPEKDEPHNHILYAFQDRFIDVGRMYFSRTRQPVSFVPMYAAPALGKVVFGAPVQADPKADLEADRQRVCRALMDAITHLADSLPLHRVVPYRNMSKRDYPCNHPDEVSRP